VAIFKPGNIKFGQAHLLNRGLLVAITLSRPYNPGNVRVGPRDPDLVRGPDIYHG
jgi:hypothetical protein